MKIMFFSLSLRGGGAERVLATLSGEMSKKNDVIVLTVHNSEDCYELSKKVRRLVLDKRVMNKKEKIRNKIKKISPARLAKLVRIIKEESPDIIITFLPLPSLYIMLAKRFSGRVRKTPVILSERGDPDREYSNKLIALLMRRLFKFADGFVFQTEDVEHYYKGIINCKTALIGNPIADSILNHKKSVRRRNCIVSCGRLELQKNYKLLIMAFAEIIKVYPEYTLEIYGEGSQKGELLKLINDLNICDNVFLKGRVDDIADRIADAGLFVMSSDYEGMPNALMEAMALGIPCVATDCPVGGPRLLLGSGGSGILVKVGNQSELVGAISDIISDHNLSTRLSKNGVKEAKKYAPFIIMKKWRTFIMDVIKNNE